MIRDVSVLNHWIRIIVVVAAICTASVPSVYAFSRWYKSWLGQLFMLQSIAFALAMWLFAVLSFWVSANRYIVIVSILVVLVLISISTLALTIMIIKINYPRSRGRHSHDHE